MKEKICKKIKDVDMAAFIDGALDPNKQKKIEKHIVQCSVCLEEFVELQKSFKNKENIAFESTPDYLIQLAKNLGSEKVASESFWHRSLNFLFPKSIFFPRVYWPIFAGVATVIILFIFFRTDTPIINYSLGNQLIITKSGPLGFLSDQEAMSYIDMKVEMSKDGENLIFTWPEVQNAEFYQVYLYINIDRQRLTPIQGITENYFMYSVNNIALNKKYKWEFMGQLEDGRGFKASAEFERR